MQDPATTKALLVIDFINEVVDERGKLAAKGYADFINKAATFDKLNTAIAIFRKKELPVIFVRLAFDPSYANQPKSSPLFGKAHEYGILKAGDWSTAFHPSIDFRTNDLVMERQRVSAFHGTPLADLLREKSVTHVFIAGVATDLAVEATARDAHDNDFIVTVVADACAAASQQDHEKSLQFLPKIAWVVTVDSMEL
ncbi:MAG: isochorismatase family cysteine hydrolase [Candidatus Peribacteraceae bacterium]|jgi:nicotinamidase-related amidase